MSNSKMNKKNCFEDETIWKMLVEECPSLESIQVEFLLAFSKTASSVDPIVDLAIFPKDFELPSKFFDVQGSVVHCHKLKAYCNVKQIIAVSDAKTFKTVSDQLGRPALLYDPLKHHGKLYLQATRYIYNSNDCFPQEIYYGDLYDNMPHGKGSQYVHMKHFGFCMITEGYYLDGVLRVGKQYWTNGSLKFEGRFTKDGCFEHGKLMDESGKCVWCGTFQDDKPNGEGTFDLDKKTRFVGMVENGYATYGHTLRGEELLYVGNFLQNNQHGVGQEIISRSVHSTEYVVGNFEHGKLTYGCYWSTDPTYGLTFDFEMFFDNNCVSMYIGGFKQMGSHRYMPQGFGRIFIAGSLCTLVASGYFINGTPTGRFQLDRIAQCPKPFTAPTFNGELYSYEMPEESLYLGSILFSPNTEMKYIRYKDQDSALEYFGEYNGSEVTKYVNGIHENFFVREGLGTLLFNEKKRATCRFYLNVIMAINELFDENENLMWKNEDFNDIIGEEHDMCNDWPLVHGRGTVYDTDGTTVMYTANFHHGRMLELQKTIHALPTSLVPLNGQEDYILTNAFKRNQIGISLNDSSHSALMSLNAFYNTFLGHGILKDPLRGSYPALRIRKVKFT